MKMASSSPISSSSLLSARTLTSNSRNNASFLSPDISLHCRTSSNRNRNWKLKLLTVRAAKLPTGVELPKVEPNFRAPFLGFTKTAEIWNSRAGMIGLIGIFIVELILNRGILQVIGIDVGKGLNLPL